MAELAWCVLRAARPGFDDAERWLAMHVVVAAIALLTGIVTLVLTAVAVRVRQVRPPLGIITGMTVVGAIPMAVLLIIALRT